MLFRRTELHTVSLERCEVANPYRVTTHLSQNSEKRFSLGMSFKAHSSKAGAYIKFLNEYKKRLKV